MEHPMELLTGTILGSEEGKHSYEHNLDLSLTQN